MKSLNLVTQGSQIIKSFKNLNIIEMLKSNDSSKFVQ
jgi:hypothetical protein